MESSDSAGGYWNTAAAKGASLHFQTGSVGQMQSAVSLLPTPQHPAAQYGILRISCVDQTGLSSCMPAPREFSQ